MASEMVRIVRVKSVSVVVDGETVALTTLQSYVAGSQGERNTADWDVIVNGLTAEQVRSLVKGVAYEVSAEAMDGTQYNGFAVVIDTNPVNRTAMMRGAGPLNGWNG
jgi:hypothetical protein